MNKKIRLCVFGVGATSLLISDLIDTDRAEIVVYSDNDPTKQGTKFLGKEVICPDKLISKKFDHIVIASNYYDEIYSQLAGIGVGDKVLNPFFPNILKYEKDHLIRDFLILDGNFKKAKKDKSLECFITGLSFCSRSINLDYLNKKTVKLCMDSQDLYYDYKIAKEVLEHNGNFRYAIVGIANYSFNYDLSMTKVGHSRIRNIYYPILKDLHDNSELNCKKTIAAQRDICKRIKKNDQRVFGEIYSHERLMEFYEEDNWRDLYDNDNKRLLNAKDLSNRQSRKTYPKTVQKNIEIFDKYIKLLINKGIEVKVVLFPALKEYIENYDTSSIENFYKILYRFRDEYGFELYDYFNCEFSAPVYFADHCHLNKEGAIGLTKNLNSLLRW